jgi:hypothetical protein
MFFNFDGCHATVLYLRAGFSDERVHLSVWTIFEVQEQCERGKSSWVLGSQSPSGPW